MKQNRKSIKIDPCGKTSELLEMYKEKMDLKSYEEVIHHFLPKSDQEFFEHKWNVFKQEILKCIPEESSRIDFLQAIEALYFVGIVNGNKVSPELINHFIEEFGSD